MTNMDLQDSEHIEHLLACIYELNQKQQYESQAIFTTMLEKYSLEGGKVEELLGKLVVDGKIHKSEQDDTVKYYIPTSSKRSRKSDGSFTEAQKKEITSYLAKSVKEINGVGALSRSRLKILRGEKIWTDSFSVGIKHFQHLQLNIDY